MLQSASEARQSADTAALAVVNQALALVTHEIQKACKRGEYSVEYPYLSSQVQTSLKEKGYTIKPSYVMEDGYIISW